jgi:small subunit ribosomal protein S3
MGRKVNPHGVRLGFNKDWSAHWFSDKNYAHFLKQDNTIREIIVKKYPRTGISNVQIFRNRGDLTISIHTSKVGVIIRRSGAGIQELKAAVDRQLYSNATKAERPNVRINILEVKNPELSAKIVAETIAGQIERRISVKRAMRQAMERTMEKRAKGIKIKVAGRLGGAEIARTENMSSGSIPLQTIRSDINYAQGEAHTTYGVIGIKVWIYNGELGEMPFETNEQPTRSKGR